MIYLDNAATTIRKPPCVIEAVTNAMQHFGNCARGSYGCALDAARTIYETRVKLAALFGCPRPERVIFTANSTEALNLALCGTLNPGDHVISTDLEHNSVLRPLYRLQTQGVACSFLRADSRGLIDYDELPRLLRSNTRAVVCTHASNLTGNVLDLARIGEFTRANGLLFVVDASQTAGELPIDMTRLGIDILCFTGHKALMGPQGTGGLCLAEGVSVRPWKVGGTGVKTYLHSQPEEYPTHLEAGTLNGHGIAGLSAAVDYLQEIGLQAVREKTDGLMRRFYAGACALPGVSIYGDFSQKCRAPVVALNLPGWDSAEVADELAVRYEIAVRAGAHCAPRLHEALGTKACGAVRFSFGWFNETEEVDAALAALREML